MAKKLTFDNVISETSELYSMRTLCFTDNRGEEWELDIDINMNPIHVNSMLRNIVRLCAKMNEADILEGFSIEKNWSLLYYIELLKYYTSLDMIGLEKDNDVKATVQNYHLFINALISLGVFEKINESFDHAAKARTLEMFATALGDMDKIIREETEKLTYSKQADGQNEK